MYTITEGRLTALMFGTFGTLVLVFGLIMLFMSLKEMIRYGIDDEDLMMLILSVVLLLLGIMMILIGLGILVVV